MKKKTTVVEIYGGPGSGKSTLASQIYVNLKRKDVCCELVREFAKDWAWKNIQIGKWDQFYFLGRQLHRESILYGKVDFAITDSPIWLAGFYEKYNCGYDVGPATAALRNLEEEMSDDVKRIRVFLNRGKAKYNSEGRYQKEESARRIDDLMKEYLFSNGVHFEQISYKGKKIDNEAAFDPLHNFFKD